MNCKSGCPENCQPACAMENCSEEHLTTFCPPLCPTCNPPKECCVDPCCVTVCDPCEPCKPCCPNPCLNRFEKIKHRIVCPSNKSCQITRQSFKPTIKCKCPTACDAVCYDTIYMKSYSDPCCLPTCW